jgi:hypothetical protein
MLKKDGINCNVATNLVNYNQVVQLSVIPILQ